MRSVSAGLDARKISHWDALYSINHSLKTIARRQALWRSPAASLNSAGTRKLLGDSPNNVKTYPSDGSSPVTTQPWAVGPNTVAECRRLRRVRMRMTKHKLRKGYLHIRVSFSNSRGSSASSCEQRRYLRFYTKQSIGSSGVGSGVSMRDRAAPQCVSHKTIPSRSVNFY